MGSKNQYQKKTLAALVYALGLLFVFVLSHNTPPNRFDNTYNTNFINKI